MKNPFEDKTDEELKILYKQYQEFQKTGVIPDNELGIIRDYLITIVGLGGWNIVMIGYLLDVIGDRWVDKVVIPMDSNKISERHKFDPDSPTALKTYLGHDNGNKI